MIAWLETAPLGVVIPLLFAENLIVFALAVSIGGLFVRWFAARRVSPPAPPIERRELMFVASTLVLNTIVTVAGLFLWRAGLVRIRDEGGLAVVIDVLALLLVMDLAMYVLHRVAHLPILFELLHAPHHRYAHPRPLTLFVLHPLETLAFGGLWLLLIAVYSPTWAGMSVYLVLNVVFGTVGHLGVEPLPSWWVRHPLLGLLAGGGFHAGHHMEPGHNFGFYTSLWDRLFSTHRERPSRDQMLTL